MTNIRDVAKKAGVSVATVSRVINSKSYVSYKTKMKVIKTMKDLGYQPNDVARVLAGKKMMTIALILPDISNPFFSELARAVEDVAQKNKFTVFICNSGSQEQKEKAYIKLLKRKYIDGIIFACSTLVQQDLKNLVNKNIPVVIMDRAVTTERYNTQGCTVISCQNHLGACIATEHLFKIGCRKIAHVCGPQQFVTSRERLEGYEDMIKQYSLYNPTLIFPGDFSIEGGRQAIRTLFSIHPDIDGVFAGNDLMAVGVMKELKLMGKQIYKDVAICGFDGIQITKVVEPEITTIAQPIYELGALASQIIIDQIMGNSISCKNYKFNVKLVRRYSTGKN